MRTSIRQNAAKEAKDWVKLALKFGLVLTAPRVWRAISDQLNDRVEDLSDRLTRGLEDVSDTATRKFGDASDRLSDASHALRGRRHWAGPVTGLLVGIGIGAGLGVMLAPAAGGETREVLRDKAVQTKNQVIQSASNAKERIRQSVPFTGTDGD
jgi:gas vesicle protein